MWVPYKSVTTAEIPLNELYVGGYACVKLPLCILECFGEDGVAIDWAKNRVYENGIRPSIKVENAHPCYTILYQYVVSCFRLAHPDVNVRSTWIGIQRVVYGTNLAEREECNHWHYDLSINLPGETDSYSKMCNFNACERKNPHRAFVYAVLPAPINTQPPTVIIPYGGEYSGREVQAPAGNVTYALIRTCWHRADARPGNRVLTTVGISPEGQFTDEESAYGRL